jgi:glycopeptide antibiotics resistance protein
MYGSFIPFDFASGASTGLGFSGLRLLASNADDLITNLSIYVPIGVACVLCSRSSQSIRLARVPLAIGVGVVVSLYVEVIQTSIALRAASWTDVMLNGIGCAGGALLCVALYGVIIRAGRRLLGQWQERPFSTCTLLLTIGLVLYHLAPFDFVTSSTGLHASFLRARWDLTASWIAPIGILFYSPLVAELTGALWFALLGYVGALGAREANLSPARAMAHAIRNSVLLIVLIEFMQLFTASHTFDLASIVLRILGAVLGARVAVYLIDALVGLRWRTRPGLAAPTPLIFILGILQISALVVSGAEGYMIPDGGLDPSQVHWIPFEALWHEPFVRAVCTITTALVTYGTLAATLIIILSRTRVPAGWLAGVGVVLVALIVESMQAANLAHTADLTTPLLAACAAALAVRVCTILRTITAHQLPQP